MKKYCLLLFNILFILSLGCTQEPAGPLFKVSDKSHASLSDALFETLHSQVFLVGEHHDNPQHHSNQLKLIQEIHEIAEKPLSIGLEMFETRYQNQLDQWIKGTLPLDVFVKIYYENWDLPWILYRDIFFYAREHQIPLIALNIPRRVVKKVASKGFASLSTDDLAELPDGITCDVTPEYENFIERVFGWHGKKNDSFTKFCEAQVLWDTVMATNILQFNDQDNLSKFVVLAGEGHAWKPGIPRQISLRKNVPMTVFLPETANLNHKNVSLNDTDYLWLLKVM
ncbi:ChaN family lipoprotein [Thermodesulfobacteriota bacterium]